MENTMETLPAAEAGWLFLVNIAIIYHFYNRYLLTDKMEV